jgi:hypothetical protein
LVSTAAWFVDCTTLLSDLDPDKLTPEMLDRISEHLIENALGTHDPAIVGEAKRRLEAGESVTVETFTRDVTEVTRPHA